MISLIKNVSELFDKKTKFKFFIVLLLIILKSLLDGFGIGLIVPFVTSISNPELIMNNTYFKPINDSLIRNDQQNLISRWAGQGP